MKDKNLRYISAVIIAIAIISLIIYIRPNLGTQAIISVAQGGGTELFNIELKNIPLTMKDWSGGKYQENYFNYFVLDSKGDLMYGGKWELIPGGDLKFPILAALPNYEDGAVIYSVVYQYSYVWDCEKWVLDKKGIVAKSVDYILPSGEVVHTILDTKEYETSLATTEPFTGTIEPVTSSRKNAGVIIGVSILILLLVIIGIFVIMPLLSKKKLRRK